jgi:hypothetical protein
MSESTEKPKSPDASKLKKFLRVFHGRGNFFHTYIRFDVNSLDKLLEAFKKSDINKNDDMFLKYKLWVHTDYHRCELDRLYCIESEPRGLMMIRRKCGEQKWNICWRDVSADGYSPPKMSAIQTLLDILIEAEIDFELAKKNAQYIEPIPLPLAQTMIDTDLSENKSIWTRTFDSFTILEAQEVELNWNNDRIEKKKQKKMSGESLIYTFKE